MLLEACRDGASVVPRADHGKVLARVAPAPRIACRSAADRRGNCLDERTAAVQEQAPGWAHLRASLECGKDPLRRLRPDARHLRKPALLCRLAKLVGGTDPEHSADLRGPVGAEPHQPPEPDELWRDGALELCELGYLARLDELAELPFDAAPDAPELASPARADKLRYRGRRCPDESSRAAIRTHAIRVRPGQVEQSREGLEPLCELGIVEISPRARLIWL